ncbi:MAG TPA: outer membrane protein assembly factor BamA [Bryobacteraceae bacterium]|nr:outer membrane protein assembly factor BamA [Bryobacteraceae bacterium]
MSASPALPFASFLSGADEAQQQTGSQPQNPPPPSSTHPSQPPAAPPKNPPPKPPNPFENVPQGQPTPNQPQNQPKVQEAKPAPVGENIIEGIDFRGQRRVPQDTLRALIEEKKGDVYDEDLLNRDFMALWNTGRFDDLRVERTKGPNGGLILTFVVTERRTVHTIDYVGNKSISKSEILDRFKERKVALSPESQYDPGRVQRAKNVIQEYEAERGHQYASVVPELKQVPPSGVDITFNINEGPVVKVGRIKILGNSAFSSQEVIRAMKNLKPIGIPHSILFENLFPRTYDSTKLDEDAERIRQMYQSKGYFEARVISHNEKVYDVIGRGIRIPIIKPNKPGKRVEIDMTVQEGDKYFIRNFQFVGMKLFRTPDLIENQVFHMAPGEVFSTEKLQKGIDALRKLYGDFGYIDFVPSPDPEPVQGTNKVDLTIDVDEGHQFFVRRIDFQGNTTTRDKVIRRELLIDEGDLFSNRLWETSILRLNQLGFFEPLKADDTLSDIKRDTKTNTVDLLLKLKERGKNSIQLNGGVSAISGSFIGFSYSTRNFLGLGETLSLNSQIGTLMSSITLGFTEPYLFDKPYTVGFTVYYQRYSYDQARQESLLTGQNLLGYYNALGTQNLLNYVSNGRGITVFLSHPLKRRSFARVGLSYGYSIQNLTPLTTAATNYFDYLNFEGITGPNQLDGIRQSTITPTFAYNTVNNPIGPTHGLRVNASFGLTGSVIGGNVNTLLPLVDVAYFRPSPIFKRVTMGFHFTGKFIAGFGGKVAPPYSRFYMGGEDDIRGFDIYSISPAAYIPTSASIPVLNNDGTPRVQKFVQSDGSIGEGPASLTIPVYQPIFPGGDTSGVFNFEYRIPILGPVTLAPFFDAGIDRLSLPSQLRLNTDQVNYLNGLFPQADFGTRALIIPGTQKPRLSTGLELQVLMPVVNAPFRLWFAYNPSYVHTDLQAPVVGNIADYINKATYQSVLTTYGQPIPFDERRTLFRFSVGRTF